MIGDRYVVVKTSFVYGGSKYTSSHLGADIELGDVLEAKGTYHNSPTELIFKEDQLICEVGSKFQRECLRKVSN